MRWREFIAGLGSIAAWPLTGRAETPGPHLADRLAAFAGALQFADLERGIGPIVASLATKPARP